MSLPREHLAALRAAQNFLSELAWGETARTPRAVREYALAVLRHFPTSALAIEDAAKAARGEAGRTP